MRVQSMAHILNEDVRCRPGDIVELNDNLALDYLNKKLVKPAPVDAVETATIRAQETAVSRGGRRGGLMRAPVKPPLRSADPEPEE